MALPSILKPKQQYNLIRLGSRNDGGYLLEKNSIDQSQILLSFGIANNWDFERDFYRIHSVPIEAFDPGTKFKVLYRECFRNAFRILRDFWKPHKTIPKWMLSLFRVIDYFIFFNAERRLNHISIGYEKEGAKKKNLNSIIEELDELHSIFIKCDIEGWEYRIIEDLIFHSSRIIGLVIEFHDVDLHLRKIEEFIEVFPLHLVHIHANNYSDVDPKGVPLVIELSFSRDPQSIGSICKLPHPQDSPNNPKLRELKLSF